MLVLYTGFLHFLAYLAKKLKACPRLFCFVNEYLGVDSKSYEFNGAIAVGVNRNNSDGDKPSYPGCISERRLAPFASGAMAAAYIKQTAALVKTLL